MMKSYLAKVKHVVFDNFQKMFEIVLEFNTISLLQQHCPFNTLHVILRQRLLVLEGTITTL